MKNESFERMISSGRRPGRREFLKAAAAAGAALAIGRHELRAQLVNKSTAKGGRIDVHHHHAPPELRTGAGRGRGPQWTPELSLEQMDKFDIAVAVLSMTQMGDLLYDGTEKGRRNVRLGNDYGAKLMADHPQRFGLFSAVPLPDLDASLKEVEYGLDTLKASESIPTTTRTAGPGIPTSIRCGRS